MSIAAPPERSLAGTEPAETNVTNVTRDVRDINGSDEALNSQIPHVIYLASQTTGRPLSPSSLDLKQDTRV
jgi:hypothetical protein